MPTELGIKVTGLAEVQRRLSRPVFNRVFRTATRKASVKLARIVRLNARLNAPVRTGAMKRSLRVRRRRIGPFGYRVQIHALPRERFFYAFIVNALQARGLGTGFMDEALQEAARQQSDILADEFIAALRAEIQRSP